MYIVCACECTYAHTGAFRVIEPLLDKTGHLFLS